MDISRIMDGTEFKNEVRTYVKLGVYYSIRRIRTYVILLYALLQIMLCYLKFLEAWSQRDKFKVCTINYGTGLVLYHNG